jgi:quercetin dioxygenase-like cupin family protein
MLHRTLSLLVAAAAFALIAAAPAAAQNQNLVPAANGEFVPVVNEDIEWSPITPPGFDEGMEIATIHGDPSIDGGLYTLRLRFPDGYRFPPHFHPRAENVTVLEGTFLLSMGEAADEDLLESYEPGDYIFIEGEHPHFGGARGETAIQLHGMGPFDIIVVGSPEDRR